MSLQREMTGRETLVLHGMLHGMSRKQIKERIETLSTFAKMDKHLDKTINKLSGGNKRKLMIIRSMMHKPKIIFLDEPTVGLDAAIRRSIWDLLKTLKSDGLTIIITTHYIEEANQLCDTIGMMREGQLIRCASPEELINEIKPYVLEVFDSTKTTYEYFDSKEEAAEYGKKVKGGTLTIRQASLEDVYIHLTNERIL